MPERETQARGRKFSSPRSSERIRESLTDPYVGILVFRSPDGEDSNNVIQSSANTKPKERPLR
jgi:hypothetical protein